MKALRILFSGIYDCVDRSMAIVAKDALPSYYVERGVYMLLSHRSTVHNTGEMKARVQ